MSQFECSQTESGSETSGLSTRNSWTSTRPRWLYSRIVPMIIYSKLEKLTLRYSTNPRIIRGLN